MKTDLLSTTYGIEGFIQPQPVSNFPQAKQLASTATNEIAIVEHFNIHDMTAICEKFLTPDMGDGTALRPDVFNRNMTSFFQKFASSQDEDVQAMLKEVVRPVMQNKELLYAFQNLMIGG